MSGRQRSQGLFFNFLHSDDLLNDQNLLILRGDFLMFCTGEQLNDSRDT